MTRDKLRKHQFDTRVLYLDALAQRCRRRFIDAAVLVGADLDQWPDLDRIGGLTANCNVGYLIPFWDQLCALYMADFANMQISMFDLMGNNAPAEPTAETAFSQWIYWHMWPRLVQEDGVVRAVLRAVGCLPSERPERAAEYLSIHLENLDLDVRMVTQHLRST